MAHINQLPKLRMIKAVPYIQTQGREKFKKFIQSPFSFDMLFPVKTKSTQKLFEEWHGKDMMKWQKFSNDDGVVLEVYVDTYDVKIKTKSHKLTLPNTIDDFINDMTKLDVEINWTSWIDENFEPKEYLHADKIKTYFEDLLGKMGKSHELL